jgi:hypothetical protein
MSEELWAGCNYKQIAEEDGIAYPPCYRMGINGKTRFYSQYCNCERDRMATFESSSVSVSLEYKHLWACWCDGYRKDRRPPFVYSPHEMISAFTEYVNEKYIRKPEDRIEVSVMWAMVGERIL